MNPDPAVVMGDTIFIAFVRRCEHAVSSNGNTNVTRDLIAGLASELAVRWKMPDPNFRALQPGAPYSSYQLYLNPARTLSIILDIFAPGQVAPIHNHCCWGVFVCLEGRELERQYRVPKDLSLPPQQIKVLQNESGGVSVADSARNAFHQVECVGDTPAISLHLYGADLKAMERDRWDETSQSYVRFASGDDPRRRHARHYLSARSSFSGMTGP